MITRLTLPTEKTGSLAGHLLIATPVIQESCFARSVIYMCAHTEGGAMGIIINYPVENIGMNDIFEQLDIESKTGGRQFPIHFGGPVEPNRGFVLHSDHGDAAESIIARDGIAVTASISILQDIAGGRGPEKGMLVLGYAGWSPGQLESEIEGGSWIAVPATRQLVFDADNDTKWNVAIATLGIDMGHFSTEVGHC